MKSTLETKIIELVKLGHERAADLKASCGAVDVRSVAQLISDLATQLDVQLVRSNELAAKLSMINGLMDAAEQANKLAQEATEKLVQERDALAAENAGLKSIQEWAVAGVFKSGAKEFESTKAAGFDTDDCLHDAVLVMLSELKTPTTNAFLAEVRAQGVEMLNTQFKKCTGMLYADSVVSTAEHFAAQLRKGGAE